MPIRSQMIDDTVELVAPSDKLISKHRAVAADFIY